MNQAPNIFDIQRASYVDGPGIRTVVFLKGCNLNCAWCHNPESKSPAAKLLFYRSRCVGCGMCKAVCPAGAVREDFTVDEKKCLTCGKCAAVCAADAKSVCGRQYDEDELMRILLRDKVYYENSGGGVTFSGGECMLHVDALLPLLKRLKEKGVSVALDTAGNVPWEAFERVLPLADLFLYDLKHVDDGRHREGTGVGNRRILENLVALSEKAPEKLIVRIPVIPGFNADDESLYAIRRFLEEHPAIRRIEPLCYHRLGEHKAEAAGCKPFSAEVPSKEAFERMKKILLCGMDPSQSKNKGAKENG